MQVAVIGLGRFGSSLARILIEQGHEVIVVDKNEALVQPFENLAEQAIIGDATDETLLRSLGVQNLDAVVVAIGDDVEASVLICISLMELGAKYVISKAENDKHAKILKRIGVHKVVQPERDSAKVIAEHLIHPKIEEKIDIGEKPFDSGN
jgi:K+ transport systems, NAD-binding component